MDFAATVAVVALELARIIGRALCPPPTPSQHLLALLDRHGYRNVP